MTSLEINGFDLTSVASPRGGRFRLLSLEGWSSVSMSRSRQPRMQQDGAWDSPGYVEALPITASGRAVYSSPELAAVERRELLAVASRGVSELTVTDASGPRFRGVELDSFVVSPVTNTIIDWSLMATAVDPLLYGPRVNLSASLDYTSGTGAAFPWTFPIDFGIPDGVTPGSVFLPNVGTASYFPLVQVEGPTTNPVLTLAETGAQVRLKGAIGAGQFVEFDMGRRTARLASRSNPDVSVSVRDRVTFSASWPAVPVGGGSLSWTADSYGPNHLMSVWGYEGAWA